MYCAFIDYKKAFDSVNRLAIWRKLLNNNIDGKCLRIIYNMYSIAKSCVKVHYQISLQVILVYAKMKTCHQYYFPCFLMI